MGKRTRSRIGTNEGVKTVRVYSANPKTADGYNTFIFRRDVARSLNKLAWAPVIDARQNRIPVGIALSDERVPYSREQKKTLVLFLAEQLRKQYGPVDNDDFGRISLQRLFMKEVQRHALATRREYVSTLSARSVASGMVHIAAAPNEEIVRRNGIRYFEYGLAKVRMDDGLYLVMGEVGVRSGSRPYYDQHVVAKFKADSEVSSLQGHIRIGEPAFEQVYDNRFRLILQGVEMYYNAQPNQTISNRKIKQFPRFSIIVPCYKVEKYIRECLDSVLAQKVDSWEAICTDDGSPDGTGAILDEYAARDSRIKVIHQENAGLSAARNAAMAKATGEWFVYLDSDDVLSQWALEDAVKALEQCPDAEMIQGSFRSFRDGETPQWERGEKVGVLDTSKELPSSLFGGGGFQRYFVRRSKFGDIPFVGLNWNEERPYFAKCYARTNKVVTIDSDFYGYRLREGSITATKMTLDQQKGNLDATRTCMRIYRDCGKQIPASVMRGFMMSWMEYQPQFIEQFLNREDRPVAWKYWFQSLSEAAEFAKSMSLWRRFTIAACRFLPFRPVPIALCYFPHWLKLKGLHR